MNYINEPYYANRIARANKTDREKRQKNAYEQNNKSTDDSSSKANDNTDIFIEPLNYPLWEGKERRTGNDRREVCFDRGRYIESRSSKDRRCKAELSFLI
jgi:hypothetical protein